MTSLLGYLDPITIHKRRIGANGSQPEMANSLFGLVMACWWRLKFPPLLGILFGV